MNIKDLPQGSYQLESKGSGAPLNINSLPKSSYTVENTPPVTPQNALQPKLPLSQRGYVNQPLPEMPADTTIQDATTGVIDAGKKALYDPFASRIKGVIDRAPNQDWKSTAYQGTGALVGGGLDVFYNKGIGGAIKAVTPESVQQGVSKVAGDVAQGVSNAISPEAKAKLAKLIQEHPELAANINATFDLAGVLPIGKAASVTKDLAFGLKGVEDVSKSKLSSITGKIIQGKPDDINPAIETLKQMKTGGVKTASDVVKQIDKQVISVNEKKIAEEAAKSGVKYKVNVGAQDSEAEWRVFEIDRGTMGKDNYVKDALESLKDLKDLETRKYLAEVALKLKKGEFTQNDINTLAKEYGKRENAFTKGGEMKVSKSAHEREAIRQGIKETFRMGLPDELKALDLSTSKAIDTKDLMEKFSTRVNDELQKSVDKSLWRSAVSKGANIVDALTGRILSTTLRQLGRTSSNIATDKMLEEALNKNLKEFSRLVKSGDKTALKKFLEGSGYAATGIVANQVNSPTQEK